MKSLISRYHRTAYRISALRVRLRASAKFWSPETLRAHDQSWFREFGY